MKHAVPILLASAVPGAAVSNTIAQAQTSPATAIFAPPVPVIAGDATLGVNRQFPSPVFHDIDGDGIQDIVVGDLRGRLSVALRKPGNGPPVYGAETPMLDARFWDIDFHNW